MKQVTPKKKSGIGCGLKKSVSSIFAAGVPMKQLLPLLILNLCEAFASSSVLTYSAFLVIDFIPDVTTNKVGYYSGILSSAYFLAQFISSPILGTLSDKHGRRIILLVGTFGNLISTCLLGFSFNYWYAVAARVLNGLVNGNIGSIKAMAADLTADSASRNTVFSNILLFSGIGSVLGGALGGILVRPAKQYDWFPTTGFFSIFVKFPYLLPNLVVASLLLTSLILGYFFLHESPRKAASLAAAARNKKATSTSKRRNKENKDDIEQAEGLISKPTTISIPKENEEEEEEEEERKTNKKECKFPGCGICGSIAILSKPGRRISLALCFFYGIYGFANTCYRTSLPVWAVASVSNGGIEFTASQIGLYFTAAGIFVIPMQMCIYPFVVRKMKLLWSFRVGCIAIAFSFAITPFLSKLITVTTTESGVQGGQHGTVFWIAMIVLCGIWTFGSQHGFASVNTLVSNSAVLELSGTVNGIGQSFVALFRMIGPISFSPLLAWSMNNGFEFPLNVSFPFLLITLVPIIACFLSAFLPISINIPKVSDSAISKKLTPSLDHINEQQQQQQNEQAQSATIELIEIAKTQKQTNNK